MPPISLLRHLSPITLGGGGSVNLDLSGVAGFFGGDAAVASMETIHIYKWRKYLGWYNTPGSYEIAKRYGQAAKWGFWDGLYPGPDPEPAYIFKLDGSEGPQYLEAWTGKNVPKSGHVAHLLMEECTNQSISSDFAAAVVNSGLSIVAGVTPNARRNTEDTPGVTEAAGTDACLNTTPTQANDTVLGSAPAQAEDMAPRPDAGLGAAPTQARDAVSDSAPAQAKDVAPRPDTSTPTLAKDTISDSAPSQAEGMAPRPDADLGAALTPAIDAVSDSASAQAQITTKPADIGVTTPVKGNSATVSIVNLKEPQTRSSDLTIPYVTEQWFTPFLHLLPIASSIATAIMCIFYWDWFGFGIIAFGMFASGASRWLIGTGKLTLEVKPESLLDSPSDSIIRTLVVSPVPNRIALLFKANDIVVMKGSKLALAAVKHGHFQLAYGWDSERYHTIGISSLLLTFNFVAQLLLAPQCTLSGQIMFLTSLGFSWIYHSILVSVDRTEQLQRKLLYGNIFAPDHGGVDKTPYIPHHEFDSIISAAVFALLITVYEELKTSPPGLQTVMIASSESLANLDDRRSSNYVRPRTTKASLGKMLDVMLPEDTRLWTTWKNALIPQLLKIARNKYKKGNIPQAYLRTSDKSDAQENRWLQDLNRAAKIAIEKFAYYETLSEESQRQSAK